MYICFQKHVYLLHQFPNKTLNLHECNKFAATLRLDFESVCLDLPRIVGDTSANCFLRKCETFNIFKSLVRIPVHVFRL